MSSKLLVPPAVDSQMYCSSSLLFETTRTFSDTKYEPTVECKTKCSEVLYQCTRLEAIASRLEDIAINYWPVLRGALSMH